MSLARATLKLPSGKHLDLARASTRELRLATKEVRHGTAKPEAKPHGVTTTAEERARAAALQAKLHALRAAEAKVTAVARPGHGAFARIERVPRGALELLAKALRGR